MIKTYLVIPIEINKKFRTKNREILSKTWQKWPQRNSTKNINRIQTSEQILFYLQPLYIHGLRVSLQPRPCATYA